MSLNSFKALHKREISHRHLLTVSIISFKVCSTFLSQEDVVPRDNTSESPAADVIFAISLFPIVQSADALCCLLCMFLCSRIEARVTHTSAAKKRCTWQWGITTQQQRLRNRSGVLDPAITTVFDVTRFELFLC